MLSRRKRSLQKRNHALYIDGYVTGYYFFDLLEERSSSFDTGQALLMV